jgi:peptide-methionine (S)-S-oxide reductase
MIQGDMMQRLLLLLGVMMMTMGTAAAAETETATFAGGCFWCMEHPFDELPGVISTTSGYTGGHQKHPTYQQVSAGTTGHTEAMQVVFDPKRISYEELLHVYWRNTDPTTANRQFCDVGTQYRPAIFYHSEAQKQAAEASKKALIQDKPFNGNIVTEITRASEFWPAEEYHQNYYLKNPIRYKFYRYNCGRDQRLKQLWGATE